MSNVGKLMEEKVRLRLFTSSIKREVRHFHVAWPCSDRAKKCWLKKEKRCTCKAVDLLIKLIICGSLLKKPKLCLSLWHAHRNSSFSKIRFSATCWSCSNLTEKAAIFDLAILARRSRRVSLGDVTAHGRVQEWSSRKRLGTRLWPYNSLPARKVSFHRLGKTLTQHCLSLFPLF